MLQELKAKAIAKRDEIFSDPNASEFDKEYAEDVVTFLGTQDGFNRVPKSTIDVMFNYLGYKVDVDKYREMYDKIMEEVNATYKYVDPNEYAKR